MLLPGEVTATAWLLAAYTVTSSPPDSALTRLVHCLACTYRVRALSGGDDVTARQPDCGRDFAS